LKIEEFFVFQSSSFATLSVMSIICLEGASAVGKTTTANFLKDNYGAFVIPEVNQLFTRPANAPVEWYLERQIERWAMAKEQSQRLVIFDGDPFQPLWYNWAYNFVDLQSLEFTKQFYQSKLQSNTLAFPDFYFILGTNVAELNRRKSNDSSRSRNNFEKHLKLIEPQRRYFQTMKAFSKNSVHFLEASDLKADGEFILEHIALFSNRDAPNSVDLFNHIVQWLRQNKA
jgi:thymidylate kinase